MAELQEDPDGRLWRISRSLQALFKSKSWLQGTLFIGAFLYMCVFLFASKTLWLDYDRLGQHNLLAVQLDTIQWNSSEELHIRNQGRNLAEEFFWKFNSPSRLAASPVSCHSLLEGDKSSADIGRDYSTNHPRRPFPDTAFIGITSNCSEFRRKRGYIMNRDEEDFPIAYSILFHQHLYQVERLLRAIYRPQNTYCLHLDGKSSDKIYLSTLAIAKCFPNVIVTSKREVVVYAGYTRLKADINCMEDTFKKDTRWKYYINLVSEVFPLKTNREIVDILRIYNGSNDIEGLDKRVIQSRIKTSWEPILEHGKGVKLNKTTKLKSPPPHNIKIVRGSAYGIFSRRFVDYIVNDPVARDLLEWSRDTYSPDEHYWATLHHLKINPHLKTPGGYSGDPMGKPWLAVYAAWGRKDIDPCLSRHSVHGVCIFGVDDLPQLVNRKELFANKFHSYFQPLATDCLEEWLYNRTIHPIVFNTYYYRQLPFVKKS